MSSQELTIPHKIRFSPTIEGKDAVNCECGQLLDTVQYVRQRSCSLKYTYVADAL